MNYTAHISRIIIFIPPIIKIYQKFDKLGLFFFGKLESVYMIVEIVSSLSNNPMIPLSLPIAFFFGRKFAETDCYCKHHFHIFVKVWL